MYALIWRPDPLQIQLMLHNVVARKKNPTNVNIVLLIKCHVPSHFPFISDVEVNSLFTTHLKSTWKSYEVSIASRLVIAV